MRTSFRRNTITLAAAAAVGAVALTGPGMAKAVFDANNAHKVDGYHASQLSSTKFFQSTSVFDNFDTCAFTDVLSRPVITPKAGILSVVSSVAAARDTDNGNEGILTTRIKIDGQVASLRASVNLENDGVEDGSVTNVGARKVPAGLHIVKVQAQECGAGMAFIHAESMTTSYSPFGSAATPPAKLVAPQSSNR